jgi:perosamine synthetase
MIPMARPVIGDREEELVLEVLRSGQLSLGPMLPRFERAFADRLGVEHAAAVSSGTAGLHLALRSLDLEPGDEVVTSPLSFVASANVALYEGARPVFADVDPVTLNLDPDAARAAVSDRTKAVLPVHIFGAPADVPALEALGPPIVEDACEALGARHADGTAVGARGHPAVFAFYANKQMTTGEGGMVVCDAATKERIDSERNQGRAPDMGWLDHDRLGFNYRLTDLQCALGIAQLERLDAMLADRARVAGWYDEALAGLDVSLPADVPGRSWFVYVVQLPHDVERDATIRALAERGVASKPYLPAIHLFAFYRERFGHREGEFPVCEDVAARSIALPFFPALTEGEVAQVAEALRGVLESRHGGGAAGAS